MANTEAEAVDFEPEDDDLMDEEGAADVDASSSPRAPLPKLKVSYYRRQRDFFTLRS
ncbi:hypothetical protein OIU76_020444 [Salix suchowensis]|nr:hypothetical protein OIU76_020444 [Salix suchowensis]